MRSTGYDHYKPVIKGRAKGYEKDEAGIRNADFVDMRIAGGGGGLYATVGDLALFHQGLVDHRIISQASGSMMHTPQVRINETTHYGFGLFLEEGEICGKQRRKHYHTGGGPGVRSVMAYYPEDQLLCVMITNVNDRQIFNEAHAVMEEMLLLDEHAMEENDDGKRTH